MPIDHFCIKIPASKWMTTKAFYLKALAPLNYKIIMSFMDDKVLGLGDKAPDFWISEIPDSAPAGDGTHFAMSAGSRTEVDGFHAAAIENGGTCNGKPGLRTQYTPTYYAAFVKDPVGNNVEVVCHRPE
ncbi:hypothetical protein AA313_de0206891 [Arthrobotrys entomopaga]|nr:hypothetical protein AA313_de0206891 [Arthrobotrys entomopaga]